MLIVFWDDIKELIIEGFSILRDLFLNLYIAISRFLCNKQIAKNNKKKKYSFIISITAIIGVVVLEIFKLDDKNISSELIINYMMGTVVADVVKCNLCVKHFGMEEYYGKECC